MKLISGSLGVILMLLTLPVAMLTYFFLPAGNWPRITLALPAMPLAVAAWYLLKISGWLEYEGERPDWHSQLLMIGVVVYAIAGITTFVVVGTNLGIV